MAVETKRRSVGSNKKVTREEVLEQILVKNMQSTMSRNALLERLISEDGKDIDKECGYPLNPSITEYKAFYEREGVAEAVVNLLPSETWQSDPIVFETEDTDTETAFELSVNETVERLNLWHYLERADELSGIGHFGILVMGFNDGKETHEPVEGVEEALTKMKMGEPPVIRDKKLKCMFVRPYDQSLVTISKFINDPSSPFNGMPEEYAVTINDPKALSSGMNLENPPSQIVKYHWTRVVHIAEGGDGSEVFAKPKMRPVFNRLIDLRKVAGGAGEMFWKGGFPGISFEISPEVGDDFELDKEKLKEEIESYARGMKRYLATVGISAKSLSVQVADPEPHVMMVLKLICITLRVPFRIFLGSEAAHLASTQDKETWNKRIMKRQKKYVTPNILRRVFDRFIAAGVVEAPADGRYTVEWPDLNEENSETQTTNAGRVVEALARYVQAGVYQMFPPKAFLTLVLGFTQEEADSILDEALEDNRDDLPPDLKTGEEDDGDVEGRDDLKKEEGEERGEDA